MTTEIFTPQKIKVQSLTASKVFEHPKDHLVCGNFAVGPRKIEGEKVFAVVHLSVGLSMMGFWRNIEFAKAFAFVCNEVMGDYLPKPGQGKFFRQALINRMVEFCEMRREELNPHFVPMKNGVSGFDLEDFRIRGEGE